jgi:hypothetical protein
MSRILQSQKTLNNEFYTKYLSDRGVPKIDFLATTKLVNLTPEQKRTLTEIEHVWESTDSYYKLSSKYYGNRNFWWIIAYYNRKPTESSIKLGTVLYIPQPIGYVISLLSGA